MSTVEAQDTRLRAPSGAVAAACLLILAAWIAAGSVGLFAEPLRVALVWLTAIVAAVVSWPHRQARLSVPSRLWRGAATLAAVTAAVVLPAFLRVGPAYHVCLVALVAALLAISARDAGRRVLGLVASVIFIFGVYRLVVQSSPAVWLITDAVGGLLGNVTQFVSGRPLSVGATFAGIDFLIVTVSLFVLWWLTATGRSWRGAVIAAAAVVVAHTIYLAVLSLSHELVASLPAVADPPRPDMYVPPDWNWVVAVRTLIPWKLPLLAALLHGTVVLAVLRWSHWPVPGPAGDATAQPTVDRRRVLASLLPVPLAAVLPLVALFCPVSSLLTNKRVVAYERGYLDWDVPQHDSYGQFSAGMFGMLPKFVNSLGGEFEVASEMTTEALNGADVLVLLHPIDDWTDEQLDVIWSYVRSGGALLVVAAPGTKDGDVTSSFNQLLQPLAMRVRRDVAVARTAGWQHGLANLAHPAALAVDTRRPWFGYLESSSIQLGWPAAPVIVGRWGWSDPGSDAVLTQQARFEPGERLGDLILAASQRVGRGRVFVLGDPIPLTNLGNVTQYPLTGRLLANLAAGSTLNNPQTWWRQLLAIVVGVGLISSVLVRFSPTRLAVATGVLMLAAALFTSVSVWRSRVVPDGTQIADPESGLRSALVYVDATHAPAYRDAQWSLDGLGGFWLTLMRNGFVPFEMQNLTRERLQRAGILVCVGPLRSLSRSEQAAVVQFVRAGGRLILMVGGEEAPASRALLESFNLEVPHSPVRPGDPSPEPEPMGSFFTPYLNAADHGRGDYRVEVMVYTGWPVSAPGPRGELNTAATVKQPTITTLEGQDEQVVHKEFPLVVSRSVGKGRVLLIGDANFALNKNLEYIGGEPFRGRYENAHYWRWILSRVTDRPEWVPPEPPPIVEPEEGEEAAP
jgi:hypothetical protein